MHALDRAVVSEYLWREVNGFRFKVFFDGLLITLQDPPQQTKMGRLCDTGAILDRHQAERTKNGALPRESIA